MVVCPVATLVGAKRKRNSLDQLPKISLLDGDESGGASEHELAQIEETWESMHTLAT